MEAVEAGFRVQDGAGCVEKFSARLEHARVSGEEFGLDGADPIEGCGGGIKINILLDENKIDKGTTCAK